MARLEHNAAVTDSILKGVGGMFWPSLCTVMQPDGAKTSSGRPDPAYGAVAGMEDIPCIKSPMILARPVDMEGRKLFKQVTAEEYHVVLQSMFLGITQEMALEVDGALYEIVGLEHDSMGTQTRLQVRRVL